MKDVTKHLLQQLQTVITQLEPDDYCLPLDYLSGASVGQHVRHILDFYVCLLRTKTESEVCYDKRNRDLDVETIRQASVNLIDAICLELDMLDLEKTITLKQKFGDQQFSTTSSILRELSYNLEHSIHHMAIIKIALKQSFSYILVNDDFGVAHSTVSHRKTLS